MIIVLFAVPVTAKSRTVLQVQAYFLGAMQRSSSDWRTAEGIVELVS